MSKSSITFIKQSYDHFITTIDYERFVERKLDFITVNNILEPSNIIPHNIYKMIIVCMTSYNEEFDMMGSIQYNYYVYNTLCEVFGDGTDAILNLIVDYLYDGYTAQEINDELNQMLNI